MRDQPKELDLLTADQVADMLQVPVNTLYSWKYKGTGPKAYRVGRKLRYERNDLMAWLDSKVA